MKIIWFSEIKWNFLTHRHHHLIRHFPESWEILFIESFVLGKENHFRPRRDGRVTYATVPIFKGTEYKAINALQNNFQFRWIVTWGITFWVKVLLLKTGFSTSDKIIFTSNIYFTDVIERLRKKLLVYDCNDYPLGFSGGLPIAQTYFQKTIIRSDLAIAVSQKLLDDMHRHKKENVYVAGNGVDYALFSGGDPSDVPADMLKIKGPIVIYCGVISDWFDFDLVGQAAHTLPDVSFVIIGPAISKKIEAELAALSKQANVFLLGLKKHSELPSYIRCAYLCMIPFKKNSLIERFSPNKLYEYMAAGKPVVTLDYTEEIKKLKNDIYVADTPDQFIEMIGKAVSENHDVEKLQHIAFENRWENKAEGIVDRITKRS